MAFLSEVLVYINPIFFYYSLAFGAGKLYQWTFTAENIWQCLWNKILDVFGDNKEIYSVWLINSYSYLLYWTFGVIILLAEVYKKPKTLMNFKIQQKTALGRLKNCRKVSNE